MVREDIIMSVKELRRVHGIRQAMEHKLTQVQAGALVGLTARHVRRLIQRVRQEGDRGLVHRGHGKPSNRRIPEKVKAKVLGSTNSGMGISGRRWPRKNWPSARGSRSATRPFGSGCGPWGWTTSGGGNGRIGRGGRGKPTWGNDSRWMGRTMTGWRAGVPAAG
jgi:hypothetical protein